MNTTKTIDFSKLTLNYLKDNFGDVNSGIDFAKTFYLPSPERVSKPFLKSDHSAEQLKEYTEKFNSFDARFKEYEIQKEAYRKRQSEVNAIIEDFIKNVAGFNTLPEESKKKVWNKAWEDGHDSGYYQVYLELVELVDLFS